MVSQELPKDPISSVLHQCAVSDMNACQSHPGGLCYCTHWNGVDRFPIRPHNSPSSFHCHGAQLCRSVEPFLIRCKENSFSGFGHAQSHSLSLSLGPDLDSNNVVPYNYNQTHILENATRNKPFIGVFCEPLCSCGEQSREDCMVCSRDVDDGSLISRCLNSKFRNAAPVVSVLQKSPYLKAAQQLLNEVVCVSNFARDPYSEKNSHRKSQNKGSTYTACLLREEQEVDTMAKLTALQEELDSRHKQYFHQMDELAAFFDAVGGPGSSSTYTALTSQAMSKHFSNLREAINAHVDSLREPSPKDVLRNPKQKRESLQRLGTIHARQIWRPLRGLPEDSVMILRAWLFEHFLHPYPSDNEKLSLASQTGLTRNQISNWFINARVRLWKPMIEEMYREEFAEDQEDSNPSS